MSASGINLHFDPTESSSATTQAIVRNHLGNMVAVLASNDTNLIDPYKISPYGLTQNGGNAKTNQLVQDKPQYDNVQIVHFGGRVYDLYSRQFLTPDPIVPNHSNISHWGRYSYGYGNPYGHVDPTGYRQIETAGYVEGGSIPSQGSGDVPEGQVTLEVVIYSDGTKAFTTPYYLDDSQYNSNFGPKMGFAVAAIAPFAGASAMADGPVVPIGDLAGMSVLIGSVLIEQQIRVHVTYTLANDEGKIYVGRTSGYGNPNDIMLNRYRYHHMRLAGYSNPTMDVASTGTVGRYAIRGREQQKIDAFGGVGSPNFGNRIRGVAKSNLQGFLYHTASSFHFGEIAEFTGYNFINPFDPMGL